MPRENANVKVALIALAVILLCGCSQESDPVWEKTIPGIYEGSQAKTREIVEIATNGEFRHEVFIEGKSTLVESGRWSFYNARGYLRVAPFTTYYDDIRMETTTNGVPHSAYGLFVLRNGDAAHTITPCAYSKYCLEKKPKVN